MKTLILSILLAIGGSVYATDYTAGVNVVTNKITYIRSLSFTNTSGSDVFVGLYNCSNTNLTQTVVRVSPVGQFQIGQPATTTNITNTACKPLRQFVVTNNCYVIVTLNGMMMAGVTITNSGPITVGLTQ